MSALKFLCESPSTLDHLDSAGAISVLANFLAVKIMPSRRTNELLDELRDLSQDLRSDALTSLWHLLRQNPPRQDKAVAAGVLPALKNAAVDLPNVRAFALRLLCDMACASDFTRLKMWQEGMLDVLLDLVAGSEAYWQTCAMTAIAQWAVHATPDVERALLRPSALKKLVVVFLSARAEAFELVVAALLTMLSASRKLREAMGRAGLFVAELSLRLVFPKPEVQISLLKMLALVCDAHPDVEALLLDHNLVVALGRVSKVAKQGKQVVVVGMCEDLAAKWTARLGVDSLGQSFA